LGFLAFKIWKVFCMLAQELTIQKQEIATKDNSKNRA